MCEYDKTKRKIRFFLWNHSADIIDEKAAHLLRLLFQLVVHTFVSFVKNE